MQRKNFNSFGKIKLVILIFIVMNMTLALGILIGQRNIFNSSYSGTLNVKNENGLKSNILLYLLLLFFILLTSPDFLLSYTQ